MSGKMIFIPAKLEVKQGEQVKFVLRNNGELDHEFILAMAADNFKHAYAMKKKPDMEHDNPNDDARFARRSAATVRAW